MADRTLQIIVNVAGNAPAAINSIRQAIVGLNTAQNQGAASANQNAQAQQKQAQATQQAGIAAQGAADHFRTFQQSIDENRRAAYAMTIAGYQLVQMGKAVISVVTDSVSQFTDFDFSLRRAAGALNIFGDQTPMFQGLSDSVQKLAVQTKLFSPEEVAKGLYFWASATGEVVKSQSDLDRVMKNVLPVMKAAAMTETEMETSIKGVLGVLQQYHMDLSRTGDVTEKLFLVTQKTAVEFPDLINSFKMVGPVAAAHNVTFEEMIKLFGELGNAGIRGTMAGRAFRQLFIQLDKPSKAATKALDELVKSQLKSNKTFRETVYPNGKFIGMAGYVNTLSKMMGGLEEGTKNYNLAMISTANELPVLIELLRANNQAMKENGKGILEMGTNLSEAGPVMERSWEQIANSADALFQTLSSRVFPVIADIADAAIESFRPLAGAIGDVAEAIHGFAEANPAIFKVIVQVVTLGGVLTTALGGVLLLAGAIKLVFRAALLELLAPLARVDIAAAKTTGTIGLMNTALLRIPGASAVGASVSALVGAIISPFKRMAVVLSGVLSSAFTQMVAPVGVAARAAGAALGAIWAKAHAAAVLAWNWAAGLFAPLTSRYAAWAAASGAATGTTFAASFIAAAVPIIAAAMPALTTPQIKEPYPGEDTLFGPRGPLNFLARGYDSVFGTTYGGPKQGISIPVIPASDYELDGKAAGKAYSSGFADGLGGGLPEIKRVFDTFTFSPAMAAKIAGSVSDALKSTKPEFREAAFEQVTAFIESWEKSLGDSITPLQAEVGGAIKTMLADSNPEAQRAGQMLMGVYAKAIQSGNTSELQPAMAAVVLDAQRMIDSGNPKLEQGGYDLMASLMRGMVESGSVDTATAQSIQLILLNLESGVPALQAQGVRMAQALWGSFFSVSISAAAVSAYGIQGATKLRDARISAYMKSIAGFGTKPEDKPKVGKGGGGAKAQSPLEKALEVAKQGAELAKALTEVKGYNLKSLVKEAMSGVSEAVVLADKIVAPYAKQVSKKTLQSLADFSEANGKVVGLIKSAVEAFSGLRDYKRPPKAVYVGIAADIKYALMAVEAIAVQFKTKALVSANTFSEQAGAVIGLIGNALDGFSKIDPKKGYVRAPAGIFDAISADIKLAVIALGNAAKSMKTEVLERAKALGDAGGSAVKAIAEAFGGFAGLKNYTSVAPEQIQALVDDIKLAVEKMSVAAASFKGDNAKVKEFADTASSVARAVKDVWDAFSPRTVKNLAEGEHTETVQLAEVFANMVASLNGMAAVAAGFDEDGLDKIKKMADAASAVGSAIKSFFDLSEGITKGTGEGEVKQSFATAIGAQLALISSSVASFVASFRESGSSLIVNLVTGMKSQESALAAEVAQINAILSGVGGTSTVNFTVATTAKPVQIEHTVKGDVGQLTAAQIASILNSGTNLVTNLGQAAATY